MSQITIQCRLVASESTRQQLWQLMAEKNTPLINELLSQIGKHPEFETWRQQGKHPTGISRRALKIVVGAREQGTLNREQEESFGRFYFSSHTFKFFC